MSPFGPIRFDADDVMREALAAESRVRPAVLETPLRECPELGRIAGCRCWLKLENHQVTGSFKARGAMNFLAGLSEFRKREVVTASTGNHGLAVAWAGSALGFSVTVVVPRDASSAKIKAIQQSGAAIRYHGDDVVLAEKEARRMAAESGLPYVPPYNHPRVIGGQAGVALEVEKQLGFPDHLLVPVGGGGLAAGMAAWFAAGRGSTRIVGCQPRNSDVMAASVTAGHIVERPYQPTLASASAGGVEKGSITFPLCRDYIHAWQRVSEREIRAAMAFLEDRAGISAEGAAAMPVAVLMADPEQYSGSTVVLVISGGNRE